MTERHILYKLKPFLQNGKVADGTDINIVSSDLDNVSATNTQELAANVNTLAESVANLSRTTAVSPRSIGIFDSNVTISSTNFTDWQNMNRIYFNNVDALRTVLLPLESEIPAGQYPVTFEISMFGGIKDDSTTTGITLTNALTIDTQTADTTGIQSPPSRAVTQINLFRGDVLVISKSAAGQDWIGEKSRTDPRTALLPSGGLRLREPKASFNSTSIVGLGISSGIVLGDAFEVSLADASVGGATGVKPGDIIVAKKNSPSFLKSTFNDNWYVFEDFSNFPITLAQIRLLAQFNDANALQSSGLLTNTRFWLLDSIPANAAYPLLTDASEDRFIKTSDELGKVLLVAIPSAQNPDNILFRDMNRSGVSNDVKMSDVFVDFSSVLPTASSRKYYLYGTSVSAANRYNYVSGHELRLDSTSSVTRYTASSAVDATAGVSDLSINQMDATTQAIIKRSTPLDGTALGAISGLQTDSQTTAFDSSTRFFVAYGESDLDEGSYNVTADNTLRATSFAQKVQILIPYGGEITSVRKKLATSTTTTVDALGTHYDNTLNIPFLHLQVILPASTSQEEWEITGTVTTSVLSGAADSFKLRLANLSETLKPLVLNSSGSQNDLTNGLEHLLTHQESDTPVTWSKINNSKLTREAAAFVDEARNTNTGNRFEDKTKVLISGFSGIHTFFYSGDAVNDPIRNPYMTGRPTFLLGDNVRFRNDTGGTSLSDQLGKVFTVEYSLSERLQVSDGYQPIVRFGNSPIEPVISLNASTGLVVRVGRGDGGTATRNEREYFQVDNSHWRDGVDTSVSEEAAVIVDDITNGETITIDLYRANNNNPTESSTHTVTVTDVTKAETLAGHTFTWADNNFNLPVTFTYNPAYTVDGVTEKVILVQATLHNAAFHYDLVAHHDETVTYNTSTTYADEVINTGNATSRAGIFDPSLYDTLSTGRINTITGMIVKANPAEQGTNPALALMLVVNGQLMPGEDEGAYLYPLGRNLNDISTDDFNAGNALSSCAISNVQLYRYSSVPTTTELLRYDSNRYNFLGEFRDASSHIDSFTLDADWIITQGHSLTQTSPDGSLWKLAISDAGAATWTKVTS